MIVECHEPLPNFAFNFNLRRYGSAIGEIREERLACLPAAAFKVERCRLTPG